MSYYVYLVRCSDTTLYCGISNNITRRIHQHNHCKSGARYTRKRRPVYLVYQEFVGDVGAALRRERQIKHLTKVQKENLIKGK